MYLTLDSCLSLGSSIEISRVATLSNLSSGTHESWNEKKNFQSVQSKDSTFSPWSVPQNFQVSGPPRLPAVLGLIFCVCMSTFIFQMLELHKVTRFGFQHFYVMVCPVKNWPKKWKIQICKVKVQVNLIHVSN